MLLLLAACCIVPGVETYRAETTVQVPGFSGDVVACSYSHWMQGTAATPCENRAVVQRGATGYPVPAWDSGGPFVLVFGEAPLMQTIFVACDGATVAGARFYPWETQVPPAVEVPLGPVSREILEDEGYGMDDAGFAAWLDAICR